MLDLSHFQTIATMLRSFLIQNMEARGYNCEWTLLSDEDVLVQAASLLGDGDE